MTNIIEKVKSELVDVKFSKCNKTLASILFVLENYYKVLHSVDVNKNIKLRYISEYNYIELVVEDNKIYVYLTPRSTTRNFCKNRSTIFTGNDPEITDSFKYILIDLLGFKLQDIL